MTAWQIISCMAALYFSVVLVSRWRDNTIYTPIAVAWSIAVVCCVVSFVGVTS